MGNFHLELIVRITFPFPWFYLNTKIKSRTLLLLIILLINLQWIWLFPDSNDAAEIFHQDLYTYSWNFWIVLAIKNLLLIWRFQYKLKISKEGGGREVSKPNPESGPNCVSLVPKEITKFSMFLCSTRHFEGKRHLIWSKIII